MIGLLALAAATTGCGSAITQANINACAADGFARADAALTAQLRRTYKSTGGPSRKQMAAHRAWIAYRDAECDAESDGFLGSTVYTQIVTECRTRLNIDRLQHLAAMTMVR
jgi:uncharacterized protein YecT (DUF1311 family)